MSETRSYVEQNTRERERLRALVDRLHEDELTIPVNEHWTVGAVFGHIAFWDGRALALADKLERGVPFTLPTPSRRTWTGSTTPRAR